MKRRKLVLCISYLIPMVLFGIVAFCSYGYDDEYFNITNVKNVDSLISCYQRMNTFDIHPPLSYMINYILFDLTDDWRVVRCIGALLVATGLWCFWRIRCINTIEMVYDKGTILLSYLMICLNPTVLLWATGVRWYTYMVFFLCILGILFYTKSNWSNNKFLFWGTYFLVCIFIFYLEYSGAILILASFICLLMKRKDRINREWHIILIFGLIAIAAVLYQIYVFFTVHYPNGLHEISGLLKELIYTAQHLLCGQAVMPVSVFGILLLIGNLILYVTMLANCKKMCKEIPNRFLLISYVCIIIAGIGSKIRNYTPLSPFLGGACTDALSMIKNKMIYRLGIWFVMIGTMGGLYNVVTHTNTTKASWNTPYRDIIEFVLECNTENENVLVVSHNPVVDFWLEQEEIEVINIASDYKGWYERVQKHKGTIIVLDSYKGSLHEEDWLKLKKFQNNVNNIKKNIKIGKDNYAWFKQILDKDYPDYYMEIYVIDTIGLNN